MKVATKLFLLITAIFVIFSLGIIWIIYFNTQFSLFDIQRKQLLLTPVNAMHSAANARSQQSNTQSLRNQLLSNVFIAKIDSEEKISEIVQDPYSVGDQAKEGIFTFSDQLFFGLVKAYQGEDFLVVKNVQETMDSLSRLQQNSIIYSIVFALFAGFCGFFIANFATQPLLKVTAKTKEMNIDHLSFRFDVKNQNSDEINELKIALNGMLEKLELGFQVQQRFIGNVSHELRTPLTAVLGYSKLLQDWGYSDPKVSMESSAAIYQTAQSMKRLIENLLLMGKLKDEEIEFQSIPSETLLQHARKNFSDLFPERQVTVHSSEFPPFFYTSMDYFLLLLKIFVENGVDYSNAEKSVDVFFEKDYIRICDQGIGIPNSTLPFIFDRFYRNNKSGSKVGEQNNLGHRQKESFGIGLSIAKELLHLLHLEVNVQSEVDVGTTVVLSWPELSPDGNRLKQG